MEKNSENYPFEKFPRASLALDVPRGRVLSAILEEMFAHRKSEEGGEVFKLSQLGIWTDKQLAPVVPKVKDGVKIVIKDGFVLASPAGKSEKIQLFSLGSPALAVFNRFNGYTTIEKAAEALEGELNWESAFSFAYTRGLFLAMVVVGVCQPKWTVNAQK